MQLNLSIIQDRQIAAEEVATFLFNKAKKNSESISLAYKKAIGDLKVEKEKFEEDLKKYSHNKGNIKSSFLKSIFAKTFSKRDIKFQKSLLVARKEILDLAIKYLVKQYHETIPEGVIKGLEVLELQKSLSKKGITQQERSELSEKVVELFESTKSYTEMYNLRQTIDGSKSGTSPLHKLVYHDVDIESCHRILKIINENVKNAYENKEKINVDYMIYSDIDDTIKGSLNDRKTKITGFYPSALNFYSQLANKDKNGSQVHLTFLSARPTRGKEVWNNKLKKDLPNDLKFFSLYGSTSAFLGGINYYMLIKFISYLADLILRGDLREKVKKFCRSKEAQTYISFAIDKRQNVDRDLLLRPEVRPIMVGDCGEGDLIFLLMKNSGVPIPLDDERIPEEYRGDSKWQGSVNEPCNPTNRPLFLSFAHDFSSPSNFSIRPDPKHKKEYQKHLNTFVFNNYVDNALYCLKKGIFTKNSADEVVQDSVDWLMKQKDKIDSAIAEKKITIYDRAGLEKLSPDLKYRIKLIQSIASYNMALLPNSWKK